MFLTIIGLIFGVASVIAMLAIAEGASLEAQRQIAELGATNIIVRSSKPTDDINPSKNQNNDSMIFKYGMTYKDFERILATMPTVKWRDADPRVPQERAAPRVGDRGAHRRGQSRLPTMTGQRIAQGRFFTDTDLYYCANVAVIGDEAAEKLFPYGDPVGQSIRIGEDHFYRIVGVTTHKAASAGTGSSLAAQDFNKDVYIPLTTDRTRFGELLIEREAGELHGREDRALAGHGHGRRDGGRQADRARHSTACCGSSIPRRTTRSPSRWSCSRRPRRPSGSSTWCWARSPASRSWSAGSAS